MCVNPFTVQALFGQKVRSCLEETASSASMVVNALATALPYCRLIIVSMSCVMINSMISTQVSGFTFSVPASGSRGGSSAMLVRHYTDESGRVTVHYSGTWCGR